MATAKAPALTAEQQKYKANLAAQVKSGAIKQSQMNAELARYLGTPAAAAPAAGATPAATPAAEPKPLAQARENLQAQVASGAINQSQANFEYDRQKGIYNQAHTEVTGGFSTPQEGINTSLNAADIANQRATGAANPNVNTALGSSASTFDPISGQWTVNQNLSPGNQGALAGIQGSSTAASDAVTNLIKGQYGSLSGTGTGGLPQTNYEQAVFGSLTRGLDEQRAKEKEQLDQSLVNRGIPVGSEAYTTAMRDFNRQYDDQIANARSTAVQRASDMQNSSINTLSGVGQAGYKDPNLPAFQPAPYNQPDPTAIFSAVTGKQLTEAELAEKQREFDAANARSGRGGSGGGGRGGGGAPQYTATSPFSSRPPGG